MSFIEKHITCFTLENENKNWIIGCYIGQGILVKVKVKVGKIFNQNIRKALENII